MRITTSLLAPLLLLGCLEDATVTATPGPTTTPSTDDCSAAVPVDAAGGVVTHLGATLDVPPDALAGVVDLELCRLGEAPPAADAPAAVLTELWEVRPLQTAFVVPATLELPHGATGDAVTVVAQTLDGAWRPDLGQGEERVDTVTAPIWRADRAYVALRPALDPVLQAWDAADVLLVVDNSCSMFDEQVLLADTAPLVLDSLDASSVDWHVGVVTTDLDTPADKGQLRSFDGALWADPSHPDALGWIQNTAVAGTSGSGNEKGLGAAYTALELLAGTANAGFRRAGAPLEVVVLSDERDSTTASLITPTEFETWFDAQTCPERGSFTSIVTLSGFDRGRTYLDLSASLGGDTWDIAAPSYGSPMSEVGRRASEADGSWLTGAADPVVLQVWETFPDAEPVRHTDWSLNVSGSFLTVHESVPVEACPALYATY